MDLEAARAAEDTPGGGGREEVSGIGARCVVLAELQ